MPIVEADTKVGEFTIAEAVAVGLAKNISERALAVTPVGNGTLKSGFVKLGLAWGIPQAVKGSAGKVVGTGLAVDGVEDIINAFFNGGFGGMTGSGSGYNIV